MKNIITFIFCLLLVGTVGISAFAAGIDDGTLFVADKGDAKYFGTTVSENCVKYFAANGSGDTFYDINGDKTMNVCDLVALVKGETDINVDGSYTAADSQFLRVLLIEQIKG